MGITLLLHSWSFMVLVHIIRRVCLAYYVWASSKGITLIRHHPLLKMLCAQIIPIICFHGLEEGRREVCFLYTINTLQLAWPRMTSSYSAASRQGQYVRLRADHSLN